jgi:hypothetical protein
MFAPNAQWGLGDMRDKAIPALTLIVAAGLIGLAQARLPRPIRDDRDGVNVEISAITRFAPHGDASARSIVSRWGQTGRPA